jgi:D-alanyl-D-alanine endopeptidase (penicillin-binding protein 7)
MKNMKLLVTVIFCAFLSSAQARSQDDSVLIYNLSTRTTEVSRNADQVRPMASVTKLMTAMVTLDRNKDLQQRLTLKKHSGSRLPPGEYTRKQLLQAMLVSSDNGAANAIADDYPGGRSAFVAEMNRHARIWDLRDTKFIDPSGLSVFNVSTARDLAEMVQIAASYWFIQEVSGQASVQLNKFDTANRRPINLVHTSKQFQNTFDSVVVSKTGYTVAAGWCVGMVLEQKKQQYVVVVLGAGNKQARLNRVKTILKGR